MNEVSPLALKTLEEIRDRGLIVLWSYQTPYPEYADTREPVPSEQWYAFHRECFKDEIVTDYVQVGFPTFHIIRDLYLEGWHIREYLIAYGQVEIMVNERGTLVDVGIPYDVKCGRERGEFVGGKTDSNEPYIRYVSVKPESPDTVPVEYRRVTSEYVTEEKITPLGLTSEDAIDDFEYSEGLYIQYHLKPETLAWLG